MNLIYLLIIIQFPLVILEMNEIDQCVSQMQTTFKNKDLIKTLAGLVGQGWNDLLNDYTLPVLATRFRKCLTDPDGEYIIPDNVFVLPVRDAEVERSSTEYDSFKEFMSTSSDKLGVSGSATVKGVQIGGSFSSENQQTKESFEKKNSIMFLNKVQYYAFDLITNDDDFDEYFIYRLQQIAEAVKNEKMIWAKFLSEVFISDFGTHLVNKATAGAEIFMQTFIDKIEKFKGESSMQSYKAEVSIGFAKIAKLSIGYETKSEKSEKHFSANSTTKSILKTRGGPDITRISKMEINSSLLHIDNLIGLKKSGKFLYNVIQAVPLPQYSDLIRYTVKHLIYNATQDFYRFNYLPGCMNMESENYNYLANVEDGSCLDPNYLFAFAGVFQSCNYISSKTSSGKNVNFDYSRCENYEKKNFLTEAFTCSNNTVPKLIKSLKLKFGDRKTKIEKTVCGFWSFIFGCKMEKTDEQIFDEIQVDSFWCTKNVTLTENYVTEREPNDLDKILRHDVLTKLNGDPSLLKLYFPHLTNKWQEIKDKNLCSIDEDETLGWFLGSEEKNSVTEYYDEMGYSFSSSWQHQFPDSRIYRQSIWGHAVFNDYSKTGLQIHPDQLDKLSYYPNLLKSLIPILDIPLSIKVSRSQYNATVENPLILHQLLYYKKQNIQSQEPAQIAFFGGAFQGANLNPFTGKSTCPPNFTKVTILIDFNLCISEDSDLKWPIRLGGFYHCESEEQICPKGYSSYLGTVFENCEYFYCIRFANRQKISAPTLNRPPFTDYNDAISEISPSK